MKTIRPLALGGVLLAAALTLTGCGASSTAPADLSFDLDTGSFTFDAVEGADVYSVGVSKELNDVTGEALTAINGASEVTKADGETVYVWSEQTGSASSIADSDGDGTVNGTVIFRAFSSSAVEVGDILTTAQLPVGHYVLQAAAASNDKVPNPESSRYEFVVPGTLQAPEGFSAQITDAGTIEVYVSGDYLLSALTVTGLPTKLVVEVEDEGGVVDTLELEDFSYTNTVLGPNKAYNFTNTVLTGTTSLDASTTYTATVTAVGDGDQILDASAPVSFATTTASIGIASPLEVTASSTAGSYAIAVTLGADGVYELTASLNDVVVARESGSYAGEAQADSTLTFTTDATDADAAVLDGVQLSVQDSNGSLNLIGSGVQFNGTEFEFAAPSMFGPR